MRKEYDFTGAKPNKFAKHFEGGSNVVLIDSDLSKIFPTDKAVNDALRALVSAIPKVKQKH
ncbi:hypothetical protein HUU42_16070 [bacterium]|nr:hypothetical protein [bacterium]